MCAVRVFDGGCGSGAGADFVSLVAEELLKELNGNRITYQRRRAGFTSLWCWSANSPLGAVL